MSKAVLIIETTPNCEHCKKYLANQHQKLNDLVKKDGRITLLHYVATRNGVQKQLTPFNKSYEQTKMSSANIDKGIKGSFKNGDKTAAKISSANANKGTVHPELLTTYWKWTPNFMLFTKDSWENHNADLVGEVYGGRVVKTVSDENADKIIKTIEEIPSDYIVEAERIMEWIIHNLNSKKFEKKNNLGEKKRYYLQSSNNGWSEMDEKVRSIGTTRIKY